MNTRLYRSSTDRVIAGVCGGLGAYLAIDPVLIRLFFVLLTLAGGSGVLLYLVLWIVIPCREPGKLASATTLHTGAQEIAERVRSLGEDVHASVQTGNPRTVLLIGAALVLLGLMFLGQNLQIVWLRWLDADVLWPLLLIAGGLALIWRRTKGAVS